MNADKDTNPEWMYRHHHIPTADRRECQKHSDLH